MQPIEPLSYPAERSELVVLPSGRRVLVRPIRPDDLERHGRLFGEFRPIDIHFRFFGSMRAMPRAALERYTRIDYEREMAFIALEASREDRELGVVRAVCGPHGRTAEFAIALAPREQGQGLGRALMERIVRWVRERGVEVLVGRVLADNRAMLELARRLGFTARPPEGGEVELQLDLRAPPVP